MNNGSYNPLLTNTRSARPVVLDNIDREKKNQNLKKRMAGANGDRFHKTLDILRTC